jgi:acyl-CoA reductase-like NAD-dependent aldehyde dehydrogenase
MMKSINHWIGGRGYEAAPERTGKVFDPATGAQTAKVAFAGAADVDRAVAAAASAYPRTSRWPDDSGSCSDFGSCSNATKTTWHG